MEGGLTLGERPDLAAMFDRPVKVLVHSFKFGEPLGVAVYCDGPVRRCNAVRVAERTEQGVLKAVQVLKDWVNG